MDLADAWERNAGDWIAWARAPGHDGFWAGTWPALRELLPPPGGAARRRALSRVADRRR